MLGKKQRKKCQGQDKKGEDKGKNRRDQVINIERKGKKEGENRRERQGKYAHLQRNTFTDT